MSWTTPRTWIVNEVIMAADLNSQLRDNMLELAPAKATKPSQLITQGADDPAPVNLTSFETKIFDIPNVSFTASHADGYTIGEPLVTVPRASGYLITYGARLQKVSGGGSPWFVPGIVDMYLHEAHKIRTTDTTGRRMSATVLFDASLVPFLFPDYDSTTYTFGLFYGGEQDGTAGLWAQRYLSVLPLGLLDLWHGLLSRNGCRKIT